MYLPQKYYKSLEDDSLQPRLHLLLPYLATLPPSSTRRPIPHHTSTPHPLVGCPPSTLQLPPPYPPCLPLAAPSYVAPPPHQYRPWTLAGRCMAKDPMSCLAGCPCPPARCLHLVPSPSTRRPIPLLPRHHHLHVGCTPPPRQCCGPKSPRSPR